MSHLIKRLKSNAKVLDIGCAVGYTLQILGDAGLYVEGIDISPAMVSFAKKRNPETTIKTDDFLRTIYSPNSYDGVLMYAFIHLFPYEQAVECINKARQILKPGGFMFIGTTKSTQSSEGFEEKSDYINQLKRFRKKWTSKELENTLKASGFEVVYQEDIQDEYGKIWMDYVVKRVD